MSSSFDTYDWDGSEAWQSYVNNLYFSNDAEKARVLLKKQHKWYKANIDENHEIPEVPTSSSSASSQQSSNTSSSQSRDPPRQSSPPPQSSTPPPSSSSSSSSSSASGSPLLKKYGVYISWVQLALHVLILLNVVTYLLPLLGAEQQNPSFSRVMLLNLLAQGVYLLRQHGRPRWNAEYGRVVFMDEQAHFFFLSIILMNAPPSFLLLMPFALRSALFVAGGLKQLLPRKLPAVWRLVSGPVENMVSRYAQLYALNATLEVLAGFMALVNLLTPSRNFMLVFGLGQYLRIRYMLSNDAKLAWAGVRARTDGWVSHSMVPPMVRSGYNKVVALMEQYSDQERMAQQQQQGGGGLMSKCSIM
jgi:hypothetical protein